MQHLQVRQYIVYCSNGNLDRLIVILRSPYPPDPNLSPKYKYNYC